MKKKQLVVMFVLVFLVGCKDSNVFSLYRSSPLDPSMRIHLATFDADESSPNYNQENCEIAAGLFAQQQGVSVRYWCEKGEFVE